jgi:hypothetical protein
MTSTNQTPLRMLFLSYEYFGFSESGKNKTEYPNIPSALKPVPHREYLPNPVKATNWLEPLFSLNKRSYGRPVNIFR